MIDALQPAAAGYADLVIEALGATPAEALAGPVHMGILAHIAAPLIEHDGDIPALAVAMSEAGDEAAWRAALLTAIATNETVIDG